MSITLLARELYRSMRRVEKLEKELAVAQKVEQSRIKDHLRRARAELDRLRRLLDGQIDR